MRCKMIGVSKFEEAFFFSVVLFNLQNSVSLFYSSLKMTSDELT